MLGCPSTDRRASEPLTYARMGMPPTKGRRTVSALGSWIQRAKLAVIRSTRMRRLAAAALLQFPLREVPPMRAANHAAQSTLRIPLTVWQAWEDCRFGRTHAAGLQRFRDANSEYTFRIVLSAERDAFVRQHFGDDAIADLYFRSRFEPMKVDIWRYLMLLTHGGWYFDIGVQLRSPLRTWVSEEDAAVITFEGGAGLKHRRQDGSRQVQHPERRVSISGMAFSPQHPILLRAIDRIVEHAGDYEDRAFRNPKGKIIRLTGPEMFANAVHDVAATNGLADVRQAGVEFNGDLDLHMRFSWVRYVTRPSYAWQHDQSLLLPR